jgi:anaerobic ribonucleoside-triphosphate reductase activating protein
MKYTDTQIGFQEFPDEISLLINISNCPFHCPGCHSPELWEDVGTELTFKELHRLIYVNKGITCIGFMGGKPKEVNLLAEYIKNIDPPLKVGWYWGGTSIPEEIELELFDFIKLGPYIKEKGGLDNPNTNQKFYHIENGKLVDWTYKFWKHGNEK